MYFSRVLCYLFYSFYKRVLYTGNVGDARAVLSHKERAVRLSYDHKGSDHTEAQRILDVGGFVMNNRVNGTISSFLAWPLFVGYLSQAVLFLYLIVGPPVYICLVTDHVCLFLMV